MPILKIKTKGRKGGFFHESFNEYCDIDLYDKIIKGMAEK